MINIQADKVKGCFLGLAVGDALGAPVEFKDRGSFPPVLDMCEGGYFQLQAGQWTDDTAMALCLAESLIAFPELNAPDLMERFKLWIEKGVNTSTGHAIGVGQNTMRVIGHYYRTGEYFAPETRSRSDGNGALMRLAPVACRHWNNIDHAKTIAALQSRVTHYSDKSAASCKYMSSILCNLISGETWEESLVMEGSNVPEEVQSLILGEWKTKSEDEIRSTGYVIDTLEAALWSVHNNESFEQAVLRAVNLGDDADTVGAVTGQLAGARYGLDAIPERWLEILAKKEHLYKTIDKLVEYMG